MEIPGSNGNSGGSWQNAPDGAESHCRFYRGEDITSAFDDGTFSASVADGTFRNIFPGDYIIKKVTVPAFDSTEACTYEVIVNDKNYFLCSVRQTGCFDQTFMRLCPQKHSHYAAFCDS